MSILDYLKAPEIKRQNDELQQLIQELGAGDALIAKRKIKEWEQVILDLQEQCGALDSQKASTEEAIRERARQIIVLDEELLLESFALYKPKFSFQTSDEYRSRLEEIRSKQKELIKEGRAAEGSQTWTVNNSKAQGKKMVNDMTKLVLRSFNNESDYCVDNVKFNNIEAHEKRIEQSFQALNKLGQLMQVSISHAYRVLKLQELHLAYEYQQKKQAEKEEQRRVREELREQQKLDQEIRQAREKIAKEKKHFNAAMKEMEAKLAQATSESDRSLLAEKVAEMRQSLAELDKEEKVIDYREQNAKAGYVYVISNIGSFGENIFKIGMTRRLEPMDRVDELGDAAVPFTFDVHALIFSENAPALEAKLHEHFYANRLNKLNDRKEFFRADIAAIELVIKENYDKVVDVRRDAPAEQYRESLLLK